MPNVNELAPEFEASAHFPGQTPDVKNVKLGDYAGRILVLAFYPADFTPVCTTEMCDFSDNLTSFKELQADVLGISTDTIATHKKFAKENNIQVPLVADTDGEIGKKYGVAGPLFVKTHRRAIFVINQEGRIIYEKTEAIALFRTEAAKIAEVIQNHA